MRANTSIASTRASAWPELYEAIAKHVRYSLAKELRGLSAHDLFLATALAVRDRLIDGLLETEARYQRADAKRVYYLSLEFLMGRSLVNNLVNLGMADLCEDVLRALGTELEEVRECEPDAALGNGGLGRLAACFLDSLATLGMPGFGYGINYEFGLFKQEIRGGFQHERPDNWFAESSPWLIARPADTCVVPVYGRIDHAQDRRNNYNPMWLDWKVLVGVPHDMPIVGYGGHTVNWLRLYSASTSNEFDMEIFNGGDYLKAVEQKIVSENISKVLYPPDDVPAGRELRLLQEYFFVACAMRDIFRRYRRRHAVIAELPLKIAIQLNDTHPALAVAELMRMLVDEDDVGWEQAWAMTQEILGYTNHTLLPEALERWPAALLEHVLPRHMQIIREVNDRFHRQVARLWPGDSGRWQRMSIIDDNPPAQVRMAHLAIVGSHSVNGVSALHSELVKTRLVPDFYRLWPERFHNLTNGVTQRRWLLKANPALAGLISETIGDGWVTDLEQLRGLEAVAADAVFQQRFVAIKQANKERLAQLIKHSARVCVDPDSLFDVHAKRIHQYKRQLLAVMGIVHEYLCLVEDGRAPLVPRTYIFAGKAAPGYWAAKQIIKLINNVARVINHDPRARGLMTVVFVPDYRVSLAERIIPAADLSEQISMAGTEASGTGNMKFALNGALTIGTLDGANIEMRDELGEQNIFIFGLTAEEIAHLRQNGGCRPRASYERDARVRRVVDAFSSERFCPKEPGLFRWLSELLLDGDEYCHIADFTSYIEAQRRVSQEFTERERWLHKAILNVARMGKFSSDRTIREYAARVWDIRSV
ncbi:MAG: glycogen/starch/alpha-glucan phosphorylase [Deltaproteobacteria bacterium]|nr:glycogen/starch/alpha-glucan phosphorylase [Deltaproteobacteria bacterium]